MKKSELLAKGSFGCIYKPALPCKDKKYNPKNANVSKLIFSLYGTTDKDAKDEFKMNQKIMKIKNHSQWTKTWTELCDPPNQKYLEEISELKKCLNKPHPRDFKYVTKLLIGYDAGKPLLVHTLDLFKKSFQTQKAFHKSFLSLFRSMESLFLGLTELQKHKICHQDMNYRNITYSNGKMMLVDYGISLDFNDKEKALGRINDEFNYGRLYDIYPYEYLYHIRNQKLLKEEMKDLEWKIYRSNHKEKYVVIHQKIFHREPFDDDIYSVLQTNTRSLPNTLPLLIQTLDTYSLGMLLPLLLLHVSDAYGIKTKQLCKLLNHKDLQRHLELFKDMTTFYAKDRLQPDAAFKQYLKLV